MKEMYDAIREALAEDPREVIAGVVFLAMLFGTLFLALWTIKPMFNI